MAEPQLTPQEAPSHDPLSEVPSSGTTVTLTDILESARIPKHTLSIDPRTSGEFEVLTCLSEIRNSDKCQVYVGEGKRQELGVVKKVINSDIGYAVWIAADDPYRVHCMMTEAHVTANWKAPQNKDKVHQFNLLWNEVAVKRNEVRTLEVDDPDTAKIAMDLVGNAVGAGLELDTVTMKNGLRDASAMIYNSKKRIMKIAYSKAASTVALFAGSLALLGLALMPDILPVGSILTWTTRACIGILGGTLGATVSVLSSFNESSIDIMAKTEYAFREGSFRVMFGIICGVLAVIGVYSGMIFGGDVSSAALLLLSVVGGYAEKFIPNILTNLASTSESKTKDNQRSDSKDSHYQEATAAQ